MADKYKRVEKPTPEQPNVPNEIRFTGVGQRKNYILYALSKLQPTDATQGQRTIVLKGMGAAVNKVVSVAEIIKRRVVGLHQTTSISSTHIVDTYEPLEQGLKTVTVEKYIPTIEITLSLDPLSTSDVGYQAPVDESLVTPQKESFTQRRGGYRGRGRGGRGGRGGARTTSRNGGSEGEGAEPTTTRGGSRGGRGRGRGRGSRGRGRGAGDA